MADFAWDPETYPQLMAREVPDYGQLQQRLVDATLDRRRHRVLDLGVGSGLTAAKVLAAHPGARLVGLDENAEMIAGAEQALDRQRVILVRGRMEQALPQGPFDLVISMLAVHHLPGPAKADLFARIARVLAPGGAFVLADLIIPPDLSEVVTPIDGIIDQPSSLADQIIWLEKAGLRPTVRWQHRDLAVIDSRTT